MDCICVRKCMQTRFTTEEKLFARLHQHLFLMMLTSPGEGKQIRAGGLPCCDRPAGGSSGTFWSAKKLGATFQPLGRFSGLKTRCPSFNQFKFIFTTAEMSCSFYWGSWTKQQQNKHPLFLLSVWLCLSQHRPFGLQEGWQPPALPPPAHSPVTESESVSWDVRRWVSAAALAVEHCCCSSHQDPCTVLTHLSHDRELFLTPPAGFQCRDK